MVKIYYGDCVLLFSSPLDSPIEGYTTVVGGGSFAKMIENLEKYKHLCVVASDPASAYQSFTKNLHPVDAAGGLVTDAGGRLLMIHRNGRWDLPKGHREKGEDFASCALREVEEETGITAGLEDNGPVHTTFHFYNRKGIWELKKTVWYRMDARGGNLLPQTVEGITSVEWVKREQVPGRAATCFPSVLEVIRTAGWL